MYSFTVSSHPKTVLTAVFSAILLALPLSVPALAQHHDIINNPTAYDVYFPATRPDPTQTPRVSTSPGAHAGDDVGYFPDDEDIIIVPGSKHFAGTAFAAGATSSAVIVGRWRDAEGRRYLIENHGFPSKVIPLRTRPEFDGFTDRFVPRTPGLVVCPLLDVNWISCDPKPQPPPPAPPPPKPPAPVINVSWLANSCWPSVCEPPPPPKPPRTPTASTGGIGYCGASIAICNAYDNTFGRAPEAGQGPAFWDDWLIYHDVGTDSQEFQTAFEDGCQNDDCKSLADKQIQENQRRE